MTKSELIDRITQTLNHLSQKDVEIAVKLILDHMCEALSRGERIEIRGFGSFAVHTRPPKQGRNPKTGMAVQVAQKHVPHFKAGKELREQVDFTGSSCTLMEMPDSSPLKAGTGKG
ncbi:integration host factor subunit beta [Thermithiobacillus plumbiphilus]|uniref:Integration host factor subunit beta n=1 Tax=Thermithiobacillus plumbiphilus TaxID=1729899 RepID=A0ABU9D462_9PROT